MTSKIKNCEPNILTHPKPPIDTNRKLHGARITTDFLPTFPCSLFFGPASPNGYPPFWPNRMRMDPALLTRFPGCWEKLLLCRTCRSDFFGVTRVLQERVSAISGFELAWSRVYEPR